MSRHFTKGFLLLSIMLIPINSDAADNDRVKDHSIKTVAPVTVPLFMNGSLSEVKWKKGLSSLNEEAFLLDQKRGDVLWHGIIDNTAKGTWSNFNNKETRSVIIQLLGEDASQLTELSVVQVEYDKEVATDGISANLILKSAKILTKGDASYRVVLREAETASTTRNSKNN